MSWTKRIAAVGLWVTIGASVFSIFGMGLMRWVPAAVARAGENLPLLMKGPTWAYMVALPIAVLLLAWHTIGWKRATVLAVLGSVVGLAAELAGTTSGLPFGPYSYTAFLEPKILGHVPVLIPLSWFAMATVCYALATRVARSTPGAVATGSLYMVLWDVSLDPAMGAGFPIWTWHVDGFFYSMPFINWVGWFATSLLILGGMSLALKGRSPLPTSQAPVYWVGASILPIGICFIQQLGWAALFGTLALLVPFGVEAILKRSRAVARAHATA